MFFLFKKVFNITTSVISYTKDTTVSATTSTLKVTLSGTIVGLGFTIFVLNKILKRLDKESVKLSPLAEFDSAQARNSLRAGLHVLDLVTDPSYINALKESRLSLSMQQVIFDEINSLPSEDRHSLIDTMASSGLFAELVENTVHDEVTGSNSTSRHIDSDTNDINIVSNNTTNVTAVSNNTTNATAIPNNTANNAIVLNDPETAIITDHNALLDSNGELDTNTGLTTDNKHAVTTNDNDANENTTTANDGLDNTDNDLPNTHTIVDDHIDAINDNFAGAVLEATNDIANTNVVVDNAADDATNASVVLDDATNDASLNVANDIPLDASNDTANDVANTGVALDDATNDTPLDASNDASNDAANDTVLDDTTNAASLDASNDASIDAADDVANTGVALDDTTNAASLDAANNASLDASNTGIILDNATKETPLNTVNASVVLDDNTNNASLVAANDASSDVVNDASLDVANDAPLDDTTNSVTINNAADNIDEPEHMKEDTNIVNNGLDADLDTVTVSQKADDDQVDVNSELDDADNALSSTSDNIDIPNSAVDYPMKHEFDSLSACNNNRVLDESTENDNIIMIPSKSMDTVTSIESTATINTTGSQAYNKEITSSREEYISHLKTIIPNVNDIASCEEDEQPIIIPSEVTSAMSMDESQLLEYQNQNQSLLNNTPSSDANTDSLTNDNNHIPSPELMVDTTYDAATYISSPSESSSLSLQSDKDIDTMPISNVAYFIQEANNTKNIAEIEKPVNLNLIDTKPTAIVHSKAEENLGLSSKETSTTEPITANCIYYPHCTNKRCKFVHPGNDNVMPPKKKSTAGNSQNGRNNTKKTMTWAERIDKQARPHPPIWKSRCVHWPKCTNNNCKYSHPSKPCRMGESCNFKERCMFLHPCDLMEPIKRNKK